MGWDGRLCEEEMNRKKARRKEFLAEKNEQADEQKTIESEKEREGIRIQAATNMGTKKLMERPQKWE